MADGSGAANQVASLARQVHRDAKPGSGRDYYREVVQRVVWLRMVPLEHHHTPHTYTLGPECNKATVAALHLPVSSRLLLSCSSVKQRVLHPPSRQA